jgi:hypothetical protein
LKDKSSDFDRLMPLLIISRLFFPEAPVSGTTTLCPSWKPR